MKNYTLEEAIVDRLELFYRTKIGNNGNCKSVILFQHGLFSLHVKTENNKQLLSRKLSTKDICAHIR